MNNPIEIYQTADGQTQVEVRFGQETVWLSQAQMAQLFDTSADNISLHLKNIYAEGELDEQATTEDFSVVRTINEHIGNTFAEGELEKEPTIRKFRIVRQEGTRSVNREIDHYNLDMIISVGYRIKSPQGVAFRRWATARLKDYLLKGYALNQSRLQQNAAELEQAVALIRKTAASPELTVESGRGLVDIIGRYAQTFLWLQQYDEGLLSEPKAQAGGTLPTIGEARAALAEFKQQLITRGEATELFARERDGGLEALLGNLKQTVFGEPAYLGGAACIWCCGGFSAIKRHLPH